MGTNRSLRPAREQILVAYVKSIIDAEEFALLYEFNKLKPIYPYWNG